MAAAVLSVTAVVVSGPAAQAAPRCSAPEIDSALSNSALNLAVAEMRKEGTSQAQIDAELARTYHLQLMTKPAAAAAISEGDSSIQAVSTGNDVTVPAPSIYRQTCTGGWYAIATYRWNTMSRFRSEWPLICGDPCALSGADGFGISFSRDVITMGVSSMTTWGTWYFGASTGRTWLDTADNSGVWFEGVDHFKGSGGDDYSFYNGQLVVNITNPGCGALSAWSKYSHTWSGVSINGVSIGYLSIGLTWSSSVSRWGKAADGASSTTYPC
jgi:hypothetical protein